MKTSEVLLDGHSRIQEVLHDIVTGLDDKTLATRPGDSANSIAWLVWHLTRVQDDHLAGVAGSEQLWTVGGWVERFRLPFDVGAIGYGQSSDEVGQVNASADLLTGYLDAVAEQTQRYVGQLTEADLARVVDERWDPPVTLAVRLVSVISDDLQHAGQAAFVRGVLMRRR
jgi:uncharacterized damage-inducible protein DinB